MAGILTAAEFDALLERLAPDRNIAGARYVELRERVLAVFIRRGCARPEDLADETMDRVARKLADLAIAAGDDPRALVFGVAWNVARESFHNKRRLVPLPDDWDPPNQEHQAGSEEQPRAGADCLEVCLLQLDDSERTLILCYFRGEKRAKISGRLGLARDLGISANALRLRIHRITQTLRPCVFDCMARRGEAGRR
jgi:DNA-directed RNA polymerase specialized sigma24 family protein